MRNEALRSLSRDHHQALVVAQQLRRARDAAQASQAFLDFWHSEGQRHFRIEEEVLLPYWARLGRVDTDAADRLSSEHREIRARALELESGVPSLRRLGELGALLARHVRFEERELFPLIEANLGPQELELLASAVQEAESGE